MYTDTLIHGEVQKIGNQVADGAFQIAGLHRIGMIAAVGFGAEYRQGISGPFAALGVRWLGCSHKRLLPRLLVRAKEREPARTQASFDGTRLHKRSAEDGGRCLFLSAAFPLGPRQPTTGGE
jgi:hypothetical protein